MFKKFAKKAIAFSAITSMLCAYGISASAANYTSSTTYFNGTDKIKVSTTVTGLNEGDEVTYLAYSGEAFDAATSEIVYVNQYTTNTDETTAKTFSYTTDAENIGSTIKMAKSDATFADSSEITADAADTNKIDAPAVNFNITLDGNAYGTFPVNCLIDGTVSTINLPVTIEDGKEILEMTLFGNKPIPYENKNIIVTPTGIIFDYAPDTMLVELDIVTQDITDYAVAAPTFIGGFKDATFNETLDGESVYGYAYAVLADASNVPANVEYGVAFASSTFDAAEVPADAGYLKSTGKGVDGAFSIVCIDESYVEVSVIEDVQTVYYATYSKVDDTITFGSTGSITLD